MRLRPLAAIALFAALASTARAQDAPQQHDWWESWFEGFADFFIGPERKAEFRWEGRLAAGKTIEIKGVNGRVRAVASSGDKLELVAVKRGRRQDPEAVEVKVVEHEAGITICAVYPSRDSDRPNECRPGAEGRMRVRNNDVNVDFALKVPAGIHFVGRTVNGSIEASGLGGNVEARTVNGSVTVDAIGHARAETVNGSIRARLGKADWKDGVAFKTVNGSVIVTLPKDASTAVHVETVNGSISNEFSLNGETRVGRRELSGTIGGGGRDLSVKTVNGSVSLRRAL
jgi:hypothetical protein